FFQAEDGIRDPLVTGVQTCALPISPRRHAGSSAVRSTCLADMPADETRTGCAVSLGGDAMKMKRIMGLVLIAVGALSLAASLARSEERRVGKECSSTGSVERYEVH